MKLNKKTILSFAGVGDLLLTATSSKSRNFSLGYLIGKGESKETIDELSIDIIDGTYNDLCEYIELWRIKRFKTQSADALKEKGFNAVFAKDSDTLQNGVIYVMPGALSCGFEYPSIKFTLFSHGFSAMPQKAKKRKIG